MSLSNKRALGLGICTARSWTLLLARMCSISSCSQLQCLVIHMDPIFKGDILVFFNQRSSNYKPPMTYAA